MVADNIYKLSGRAGESIQNHFTTFEITVQVDRHGKYAYVTAYRTILSRPDLRGDLTVNQTILESEHGPRLLTRKGGGRVFRQEVGEVDWVIDTEIKYGKQYTRDMADRVTLSDYGFPEPEFRQSDAPPPSADEHFNLSGFVLVLSLPLIGILLILVDKWLRKAKLPPAEAK
jgi:hypothetical protein